MTKEPFKSKLEKLVNHKISTKKTEATFERESSSELEAFQKIREYLGNTLTDANTQLQHTGNTLTIITPHDTKNLKSGEFVQVFLAKGEETNFGKSPYLLIEADSEDPSQINISDRFFKENDQKVDVSNANEELIENTVYKFLSSNL